MRHKNFMIFGCATLLIALATAPAQAQRSPFLFTGYYYQPAFAFGQWYPYPHPVFGFPGPSFFGHDHFSSVRLQITPREALVYVDGYAAGMVDDFDGVFQRLHLIPGHHEIVVYLQGYRSLRQNLYLNPGSSHTIRHTMTPLGAGEPAEPQPVPLRPPPYARGVPPSPSTQPPQAPRQGTLSLRLQPGDANVVVDGELWRGPQSQDRLVIHLPEGIHQLRVEKAGFQTFAVEVEIKSGETTSFNVSLLAQ